MTTSLLHPDRHPAARHEVFAKRLRAAIDRKGWSISETARRAAALLGSGSKFGDGHVWQYVHGRSVPRTRYLHALSRALGVEPHHLQEDLPWPTPERTERTGRALAHVFEDPAWPTPERKTGALSPVVEYWSRPTPGRKARALSPIIPDIVTGTERRERNVRLEKVPRASRFRQP